MPAALSNARLVDQFGQPLLSEHTRSRHVAIQRLRARYDAAETTAENAKHWTGADGLSASAAASPQVRETLRNRARYECQESNSFAKGIIQTLAHDTIGPGPRLQILTDNQETNRRIEEEFSLWARQIGLGRKLRTMRIAKAVDGEAFALQITNPRLNTPVQLDLRLIEADQIATPILDVTPNAIDGIKFDAEGNPTAYHLLKSHPGDDQAALSFLDFNSIPASQMIHLFREDRPGQRRGLPEIATALPLFALLRRYTLAVVSAAETVADIAGVIYTDSPAVDVDQIAPMDAVEMEMRALLTLPTGWKMAQIKAEQPATTYEMFRNAILNEIARCVSMPFNKAAGNSAGYNFASGRLDHQTYFEAIAVERCDFEQQVLDRILMWWLDEATLLSDLLPDSLGQLFRLPHRWFWPRHRHVDPQKEANASTTLWNAGLLSDDDYLFREGIDPDEHYRQIERQQQRRAELGLPLPGVKDTPAMVAPDMQPAEGD